MRRHSAADGSAETLPGVTTVTRTFIAIELDTATREDLRREISRLTQAMPDVRFVDPASLHLTLAFLGELDDTQVAEAMAATAATSLELSPFTLQIGALGTFGPVSAPRVIWAGVTGDVPALHAAQMLLTATLEAHGFAPDRRPFAPHLTLARVQRRLEEEALARLTTLVAETARSRRRGRGPGMTVEALAVMRSDLLRSGARYRRLQAYRFMAAH
jgi:2'-5' RNA ligase